MKLQFGTRNALSMMIRNGKISKVRLMVSDSQNVLLMNSYGESTTFAKCTCGVLIVIWAEAIDMTNARTAQNSKASKLKSGIMAMIRAVFAMIASHTQ